MNPKETHQVQTLKSKITNKWDNLRSTIPWFNFNKKMEGKILKNCYCLQISSVWDELYKMNALDKKLYNTFKKLNSVQRYAVFNTLLTTKQILPHEMGKLGTPLTNRSPYEILINLCFNNITCQLQDLSKNNPGFLFYWIDEMYVTLEGFDKIKTILSKKGISFTTTNIPQVVFKKTSVLVGKKHFPIKHT